MSATKSFSLSNFGCYKETENPAALNYALNIRVHPPEISPKNQFWTALNFTAVTLTNIADLCTPLVLERDSQATGLCNGSRTERDKAWEERKRTAGFLYLRFSKA